ncbi:unnamed protein product [Lactuca saligna]|uniref:DUF1985 domain-containing protein n=1 Tax=Lactuca saligna TaxID=75948 RepID=A0AA35YVM5_LACSI|nr:unnamed protein product [Lactuca saligna]
MPDNQGDYYEAALTIKAKLGIAKEILKKLKASSDARLKMFKTTCFGRWLDISTAYGDPLLVHLMLQTQIYPEPEPTEMWFRVGGYELRFGQMEFCLVTGFRFGHVPSSSETSKSWFRIRLFSRIPSYQSLKVSDLLQVFRSKEFAELADVDAVRICLLILLEVGFMGHEDKSVVSDRLLCLVDDLVSWNKYPWGSYIWPTTYNQLNRALSKRGHHVGVRTTRKRVAKYTLTGFVYAFKIWIFEMFPIAREFAMRERDVIPRAIAWRRTHALSWDTCQQFLDVDTDGRHPQTELTPTTDEQSAEWWIDSCRFFNDVSENLSPLSKKSRLEPPSQNNEVGSDDIEVEEQKPPLIFRDGRPQTHPDPTNESSYTAIPSMSHPVPPPRPVADTVPEISDFGTALSRPFFMSFYYGGNIEYENGEINRDESTSTFTIPARHKMRYQEFVDLVYAAVGVEKEKFKLKFTLHFELCGKPNSSLITSDGTLDLIFFLAEKDEGFRAHIYFEMVEILQGK